MDEDGVRVNFFVFFGLIAGGKSTLAEAWANQRGFAYYNSDRVRKELAGIEANREQKSGWSDGIYSKEFSRRTYDALLERAEAEMAQGRGVVLDASYHSRTERDRVRNLAGKLGENVVFILCSCSDEEVKSRLAKRALDPEAISDGRWDIYVMQKEHFEPPTELEAGQYIHMNTQENVDTLLANLEGLIAA